MTGWGGGGEREGPGLFDLTSCCREESAGLEVQTEPDRLSLSLSSTWAVQHDRDRHVTRGGSMMSSLASMLPPPCGCLTCQTVCLLPPTLATGLHHLLIRQTPADCRHAADILQRVSPSPAGIVSNWTIKYLTRQ